MAFWQSPPDAARRSPLRIGPTWWLLSLPLLGFLVLPLVALLVSSTPASIATHLGEEAVG